MLATADYDNVIHIWSTSTWTIVAELRHPHENIPVAISQLYFSPRGDRLIALHHGRAVAWDVATWALLWEKEIAASSYNPRTDVIISSYFQAIDARTGAWIREYKARLDDTWEGTVCITSDRTRFVSIVVNGGTDFWDDVGQIPGNHALFVRDVATLALVDTFVVPIAPMRRDEAILYAEYVELMISEERPYLSEEASVAWLSCRLITGGPGRLDDGDVLVCRATDGNTYLVDIERRPWHIIDVVQAEIAAWSPDRRFIVVANHRYSQQPVRFGFDIVRSSRAAGRIKASDEDVEPVARLTIPTSAEQIYDVTFSPDGRFLAVASGTADVHVFAGWELKVAKATRSLLK